MTSSWRILSVVLITIGLFINETNAVFGGQNAKPNEFTFAVRITLKGHRGLSFCGGTIISPRHILTAAHCVENFTTASILSGVRNRLDTDDGIVTEVEKMISHPDNQEGVQGHDIGILVLKEALILGGIQNKISLPTKAAGYNVYATIAGWGIATTKNPVIPKFLQKAPVKLFGCDWCHRDREIPICLCGTHESSGFCSGDSGSGLVANSTIIGIAAASNCVNADTDYYTSVHYNLDWIHSVMNETS